MLKRAFDLLVSAGVLIVLSPLLLILALLVRLTSTGPALYRAKRVGRGGVPFELYKFRSMVQDADKVVPGITVAGDARITPIGGFLRRTKLDELPQFFNVLKGDMSVVGPRPEDPRYVAIYTSEQRKIFDVRPGITSLASVFYRHEEQILAREDWEQYYVSEVLPSKLAIDLEYIDHANVLKDLEIVFRTFVSIFRKS